MEAITQLEKKYRKPSVPEVHSGDTVRVHALIKEGAKTRVQMFEGVVIRTHRPNELTANVTVRRIASGVGVEKTFLLHSPNVQKLEIIRRAKVRRNFLSYLRDRRGKSARLQEIGFDRVAANAANEPAAVDEVEIEAIVAATDVEPKPVAEISIDEVAKDESVEAAASSASGDKDAATDEQQLEADEVQSGLDKAEKETDQEAAK